MSNKPTRKIKIGKDVLEEYYIFGKTQVLLNGKKTYEDYDDIAGFLIDKLRGIEEL